ncbi:hypothetical protein SAMN04488072_111104 [Lentibacillus halodurans]|uniref:Uncharacterized protein n=1 Tax=Lentibacillus halodurans TaxID=237679 RepID=A0A1I0ZH34_9BACI|nr:hypothetical protein [Lentibacillus halodurans]SFB25069.1 hypothetical protein SAMN04488072_111104 [Lentibacillus halodurans]
MVRKNKWVEDKQGISAVQNQLFESYQSGVIEDKDKLSNNRSIHTYNNQKN